MIHKKSKSKKKYTFDRYRELLDKVQITAKPDPIGTMALNYRSKSHHSTTRK